MRIEALVHFLRRLRRRMTLRRATPRHRYRKEGKLSAGGFVAFWGADHVLCCSSILSAATLPSAPQPSKPDEPSQLSQAGHRKHSLAQEDGRYSIDYT